MSELIKSATNRVVFMVQCRGIARMKDDTIVDQGWWDAPMGLCADEAEGISMMAQRGHFPRRLIKRTTNISEEVIAEDQIRKDK